MKQPQDFDRRILLVVTGMSPQVVTETLWSLVARKDADTFVPTEIQVVTTSEGADRARLQLLSEKPGYFHQLVRDYNLPPIRFSDDQIHVIRDPQGVPLSDIRSPGDNEAAADYITDLVRTLTAGDDDALHVSIAGGRKTMGYYLGYALSLYGRAQDRLSHVLVSAGYENSPDFFYPTPFEHIIYVGPENQKRPLDCAKAVVDMASIPFVRLRQELAPALLHGEGGFTNAVAATNRALAEPELIIDRAQQKIYADGREIPLGSRYYTLYWWIAESALRGEASIDLGSSDGVTDFMQHYKRIVSKDSADFEEVETALGRCDGGEAQAKYFSVWISRCKTEFEAVLGKKAAKRYQIRKFGRRAIDYLYGFELESDQIVVR